MSKFKLGRFEAVSVLSVSLPDNVSKFFSALFHIVKIAYGIDVNVPNTYVVCLEENHYTIIYDKLKEEEFGGEVELRCITSMALYTLHDSKRYRPVIDVEVATENDLRERIYEIHRKEAEEEVKRVAEDRGEKLMKSLSPYPEYLGFSYFGNYFCLIHVSENFDGPDGATSEIIQEILTEDCEYFFVKESDGKNDDPSRKLEHDLVHLNDNGSFSEDITRIDVSSEPYVARLKEDSFSNAIFRNKHGFMKLKCKWLMEPDDDLVKSCNYSVLFNLNKQYMGEPNMSKYIGEFNPMRDMRRMSDEINKHDTFRGLPSDAFTYTRIKKHIWDFTIKDAKLCDERRRRLWYKILRRDLEGKLTCYWRLMSPKWDLHFGKPTNNEVEVYRKKHDDWMRLYGNIAWENSCQCPDPCRKCRQIEKEGEADGKKK